MRMRSMTVASRISAMMFEPAGKLPAVGDRRWPRLSATNFG